MATRILPEIDPAACTGCGECVAVCPTGALAIIDQKAEMAYPDRCEYDGRCEPICPTGAIELPYLIVLGSQVEAVPR